MAKTKAGEVAKKVKSKTPVKKQAPKRKLKKEPSNPFESKPDSDQAQIKHFLKRKAESNGDPSQSSDAPAVQQEIQNPEMALEPPTKKHCGLDNAKSDQPTLESNAAAVSLEHETKSATPTIAAETVCADDSAGISAQSASVNAPAAEEESPTPKQHVPVQMDQAKLKELIDDAQSHSVYIDKHVKLSSVVSFWKRRAAKASDMCDWAADLDTWAEAVLLNPEDNDSAPLDSLCEQAKKHHQIKEYETSLRQQGWLDDDWKFCSEEGDPLEDLKDFIRFLVPKETPSANDVSPAVEVDADLLNHIESTLAKEVEKARGWGAHIPQSDHELRSLTAIRKQKFYLCSMPFWRVSHQFISFHSGACDLGSSLLAFVVLGQVIDSWLECLEVLLQQCCSFINNITRICDLCDLCESNFNI